MSSRNMIAANTSVFASLDEYCSRREEPIANAGSPRWISTTAHSRELLIGAKRTAELSFSSSVKIARYDYRNRAYFITSGLDSPETPTALTPEDVDSGLLTAFLADLTPTPCVSPTAIRNIVEVADKTTPGYDGHDLDSMQSLFPRIQVFSVDDLVDDESFKTFFLICLADRRRIDQWIDQQLVKTLYVVTDLNPSAIPYAILCRSTLDMDPSNLFLGLYRCLEALYAHTQAKDLMAVLGLSKPWTEMAETLEATLGWYPREEPSLEALLSHAVSDDLHAVMASLGGNIPEGARLEAYVAKRIYQLRNALVHYRPFIQRYSPAALDWNRLCEAMALLVVHIYGVVWKE
jgi:hypothetical protein